MNGVKFIIVGVHRLSTTQPVVSMSCNGSHVFQDDLFCPYPGDQDIKVKSLM